jgi:hypothetical protein
MSASPTSKVLRHALAKVAEAAAENAKTDIKPISDPGAAAMCTVLALAAELSVRGLITFPGLADRLELMASEPNVHSAHAEDMREIAKGLRRDMVRALGDLEPPDRHFN